MAPKYVIDTCSLIHIKPENYPHDIYKSQWDEIGKLIRSGRLISHKQVLAELKRKDDGIFNWASKNKIMFQALTPDQIKLVKDIINKFPTLIDPDSEVDTADPYLIALAMQRQTLTDFTEKPIIVTQEVAKQNKINIPSVCANYGINCIDIFDMFRSENWKF